MALPTWPISNYLPQSDGFQPIQRILPPITTEMEGGNTRQRARPGDNVGTLKQVVRMTMADHDTFVSWVKSTLGNGTGRFTMMVWLGSAFASKTCQFTSPCTYSYVTQDVVDVGMSLRVYNV